MRKYYVMHKTYRCFFTPKKDSKENCQNNNHNWNNNTNCYIGLFFSLFDEILQEKHIIPVMETPKLN